MRQVKGTARKKTTKRRAPSKKKASPRRRGKQPTAARVWERRIEGWRRFLGRHAYLRTYALLSVATIALYGVWASGFVERSLHYADEQAQLTLINAGFTVQRITIEGQDQTSPGAVMDALEIEYGDAIFGINLDEMRARVEELDWVDRAIIVRALPGSIHVIIEERQAFAVWQRDGAFRVIAANGDVIETARADQYAHLPQVIGAGANHGAGDLFLAVNATPILAPRVRYAVRVGDRRWDLHLDNGVVVKLPEVDLGGALRALVDYDQEHRLLARAVSIVDMRLADRIVVTPSDDGEGLASELPDFERET